MRRLIILTIAFTFICMPLLAQESGSGADAEAGEAGGCGKIMLGGMGSVEGEGTAVGTGVPGETDAGYYEDDLYYEEGQIPAEGDASVETAATETEAECGAPDADGIFICTDAGIQYTCYCCDAADQQIPYSDTCDPCCME